MSLYPHTMKLIIVLLLVSLLPSIRTYWQNRKIYPVIYGRKEIQENVILHDFTTRTSNGEYLLGGEYRDNSSSTTKGFLMHFTPFIFTKFNFLYSTGTQDIVNKVAIGYDVYYYGAGKSGIGSSASFFLMMAYNRWVLPDLRQIGGDTNYVDPTSEIGKSFQKLRMFVF